MVQQLLYRKILLVGASKPRNMPRHLVFQPVQTSVKCNHQSSGGSCCLGHGSDVVKSVFCHLRRAAPLYFAVALVYDNIALARHNYLTPRKCPCRKANLYNGVNPVLQS